MLTKLYIKNFKKLDDVQIVLGKNVVFIGPNNSGKSSALQALALWDIGFRRWMEKRKGKSSPEQRPGVTINRRDLISIPVPVANLLWKDLHVRESKKREGKQGTQNVLIEIIVEGVTQDKVWKCGLEFDYANDESFFCRPLRVQNGLDLKRMSVPSEAESIRVAFLPPMSGLSDREFIKQPGEIGVLLGQGQTAQVLRNLCYQIFDKEVEHTLWKKLTNNIKELFGVRLLEPVFIKERSEIVMGYEERNGLQLDLSSSGRGMQQTLLLLTHLYANPGTVLLLDEPDAHLEVLRQRQTYQMITSIAEQQGAQVIAASHSEVVLNEAAGKDTVIAFVGKPHILNDRPSQLLKSLNDIGFDQYYQAEETGWVLYLEGPSDLHILQTFANTLQHPVSKYLERPFVSYISTNLPQKARDHFHGLKEAKNDLIGIAIFDRLDKELRVGEALTEMMWRKREIENYLCIEDILIAYTKADQPDNLFGAAEADRRELTMKKCITEITQALQTLGMPNPWSDDIKASDDFLDRLFKKYFEYLKLPILMSKKDYHVLASFVPKEIIDIEIIEKFDAIMNVAQRAQPRND